MKLLFLPGWQAVLGGVKPTVLAQHGPCGSNPKLPDAQAEFDKRQPQVVMHSSQPGSYIGRSLILRQSWDHWPNSEVHLGVHQR